MASQDDQAMAALLQGLMSSENEVRSQAETAFAELKKHPDACVTKLIQGLRTNPDAASRSLCAVLLRKVRGRSARLVRAGRRWSFRITLGWESPLSICRF